MMMFYHMVRKINYFIFYFILLCSLHSEGPKGVGPSTTLAWPGWKQPDITVKVDTARLETGRFKKGFVKRVLLYCPSTECESTFNVY